jgi:translation elongation factor EF-G
MFNNNDFGRDSQISSQLLNIYIKNLFEHKVEEKIQEINQQHEVFDNIFSICENIEDLVQSLYNNIESTSIEEYDTNLPQNNDDLIFSSQFDTKLVKKSYDKLIYYDEILDKIITSIQYKNFSSSSNILIKLNKNIQNVDNALTLLKRFFFKDDETSRINYLAIRYLPAQQNEAKQHLASNLRKISSDSISLLNSI